MHIPPGRGIRTDPNWNALAELMAVDDNRLPPMRYAKQILIPACLPTWPLWGSVGGTSCQWVCTLDGEVYLLTCYRNTLSPRPFHWYLTLRRRSTPVGQPIEYEVMYEENQVCWATLCVGLTLIGKRLQAWEAERAL